MENQKFNPVVWFEMYVDDMERASKFFEKVLNITLSDMSISASDVDSGMQMRAFPSPGETFGGAAGALVKMEGMKAGGAGTIVYFGSADCAVEQARIETAGGKVIQPKMSIGENGFIALGIDTEGNTFGLHSIN